MSGSVHSGRDCTRVPDGDLRGPAALAARARSRGEGVVTCRAASGWTAPAFITVTGGSAGFQIGIESSDVVMLVTSDRGISKLFQSGFTVGVDATAAAGPVGNGTEAATDPSMTAEVLKYARSRGLFAGAELSGAVVKPDRDALVAIYRNEGDVHAILAGSTPVPSEAEGFVQRVASAFPSAGQ
jgi:lipid-binding SYLF domain-containing protein